MLDAPLRGPRYIAADGCCDAPRHVRSTLPLNGQRVGAQRFAIDWERLDEQGRIYMHFHVTEGPSGLASNGVPYLLRRFSSTQRAVSTAAVDSAIITGQPVPLEPIPGGPVRRRVLPLDRLIVDFPE